MTATTELIAEARERFENAKAAHGDSSLAVQKMLLVAGFVPRLADALEKSDNHLTEALAEVERLVNLPATAAPSDTDREALVGVIEDAEGRYDDMSAIGKSFGLVVPSFERFLADAILAAGFSRTPQPSTVTEVQVARLIEEARAYGDAERRQGIENPSIYHRLADALAARLAPAQPEQVTTVEELEALPVGSVVMSIIADPFEQRVWQKFGGVPERQFGYARHEWQSTDGGFVRVGNSPVFNTGSRTLTVLYRPVTPEGEKR